MRAFFFARGAVAAALVLGACSGAHATDLTGHWRLDLDFGTAPAGSFLDISQVGDAVTILAPPDDRPYVGTLAGDSLLVDDGNPPCPPGPPYFCYPATAPLAVMDDGRVLDGRFYPASDSPYGLFEPVAVRTIATRCECYDANTTNGDGCDSNCRIEPCFDCAGDPSTCTPQADGASCDDAMDCTTGTTCEAGACTGGSTTTPCVDVTGRWAIETTESDPLFPIEDIRDVTQRDGYLEFRSVPDGHVTDHGKIDAASGAFTLLSGATFGRGEDSLSSWQAHPVDPVDPPTTGWGGESSFFDFGVDYPPFSCNGFALNGVASSDGGGFTRSGVGSITRLFPGFPTIVRDYGCVDVSVSQTARRCGPGECLTAPSPCPPCSVPDGAGACVEGPVPTCKPSRRPASTTLAISTDADPDFSFFDFQWKAGAATSRASLGDPNFFTGYTTCFFDESGPTPQLVYRSTVFGSHAWTTSREGRVEAYRLNARILAGIRNGSFPSSPTTVARLIAGGDGKASVEMKGRELGDALPYPAEGRFPLPVAPLALPLHVQVQSHNGGACFDAVFDSTGVRKNKAGQFRAAATR